MTLNKVMDPVSVMNVVSGALGLFGKKKSDAERRAEEQAAFQAKVGQEAYGIAHNFDPVASMRQAVAAAQAKAADAMNTALTRDRMNFGGRTDDTRFLPIAQRSADDTMSPLYGLVANSYATAAQQKLDALGQAMGIASPMSVAQFNRATPQPDLSGTVGMIANGVNGMIQSARKPAAAGGSATPMPWENNGLTWSGGGPWSPAMLAGRRVAGAFGR